jgi:hypothetical protein
MSVAGVVISLAGVLIGCVGWMNRERFYDRRRIKVRVPRIYNFVVLGGDDATFASTAAMAEFLRRLSSYGGEIEGGYLAHNDGKDVLVQTYFGCDPDEEELLRQHLRDAYGGRVRFRRISPTNDQLGKLHAMLVSRESRDQ